MPSVSFQTPLVIDNKDGWGPTEDTFQYKDMPYQPYSKSDQLGKVMTYILNFPFVLSIKYTYLLIY